MGSSPTVAIGGEKLQKMVEQIQKQEGGFRFGEIWRHDKNALGLIVPIVRENAPERDYVTLHEVKDDVKISDTGRISELEVTSKAKKPVFIRVGSKFEGLGTQSRAANFSVILMPKVTTIPLKGGKQSVPIGPFRTRIPVQCIHASHPIRSGNVFSLCSTTAPRGVEHQYLSRSNQSSTWDAVSSYHNVAAIATVGSAMYSTPSDNLIETQRQVDKFSEDIENIVKEAPHYEDQVGAVFLDVNGVVGLEVFDSPQSWSAFSEDLIKKYGDILAKKQAEPIFELREDIIPKKIDEFLGKLLACKTMDAFSDVSAKTESLEGEGVLGEYTMLNGNVIHLLGVRKESA